jgi:hypothetical protein
VSRETWRNILPDRRKILIDPPVLVVIDPVLEILVGKSVAVVVRACTLSRHSLPSRHVLVGIVNVGELIESGTKLWILQC